MRSRSLFSPRRSPSATPILSARCDALRRGLLIAQDSGNRTTESDLAALARLEAKYGDPLAALEYFTVTIRNYHDAGNTTMIRSALASSPPFWTGSDATTGGNYRRFRLQSPRRGDASPKSTPRSPTYARSSATRPTNRSPARVRR